ncbi:MAG: hypothetical protein NT130_04380 [Candidatus Micrarchaeota archaeon]|nr:hypothetical protein [Candidatus Micrarchaeota archaeon]
MPVEHKVMGIEDRIAEDIQNAGIWATKDGHPFEVKVDAMHRAVDVSIWRGEKQPGQGPWMLLHFERDCMSGHIELTYSVNVTKNRSGYGYTIHANLSPIPKSDLSRNALKLHEIHEIKSCEEALEMIRQIVDKHFFNSFRRQHAETG